MMKAIRRVMIIFAAASAVQAHAANVDSGAADVDAQAAALGQCLVNKSTGEDRVAVARWMLALSCL